MSRTIQPMITYTTRVVERELDALLEALPALSLEGPKGVGKTRTAERRQRAEFRLDDAAVLQRVSYFDSPDRLDQLNQVAQRYLLTVRLPRRFFV